MGALRQMHASGPAPASAADFAQGERRQITVLFCDLVGSTEMSERLDLDDLHGLIHAYYSTCCNLIETDGGFIARLLGDGILAYFGYPMAREDAAECAIRAGLRIIETFDRATSLEAGQVSVRIGVATGISVISDMVGSGFAEHHAVTGLTPNLASRIQALATPGSMVVADETRRLAGGMFVYEDLGLQRLKGIEKPVPVWRVAGETLAGVRFDAHRNDIFECIGREAELQALRDHWSLAQLGHCCVVNVVGDAGIGKSRLARTASELFARPSGFDAVMQCAPHQMATPLHPLITWIRREAGVIGAEPSANRQRLADWLGDDAALLDAALLADFLGVSIADAEPLSAMPPDRKRNLTRELILRHFERHCDRAPVLLVVEDAHWMDGATEDFLKSLFRHMRHRPLLAMITSRPSPRRDWDAGDATEIRLEPLRPGDAEKLVRNACRGQTLPQSVVGQILARTDGIPLFLEELTAAVLESSKLQPQDDAPAPAGARPAMDIPLTLRDSLMARLDRLSEAKEIACVASAIGREFSVSLLSRVAGRSEAELNRSLDRLVEANLLFRRGLPPSVEYVFKHALIQQAAYEGQLRGQRQALHARIVHAIEVHQPDVAAQEPGLMAHHCHEATLTDKEVDYLYAAGRASTRMVAIAEALSYFSRAEEVVARLEQSPRHVRKHIDVILGLMEVGRFAILPTRLVELGTKARSLARIAGVELEATALSSILFQEGRAHLYSSRYHEARRIFEEIRQLGRDQHAIAIEMKPASAFSMNLCCQGLFGETLAFIDERNVGYYKQTGSVIDYISGLGWIAYASCQTGPGDAGLRFGDLSVSEAESVQSPIYLGGACIWRSHALMAVRRLDEAVADARRCVELSKVHSVPYLGWHGLVFLSLCQCRSGDFDAARASLAEARELLGRVAAGHWSLMDYLPAIEAEIACFDGDPARASIWADQALAVAQPIGGHFAEAIAWRVKAIASIRAGSDPATAQALFDHAARLHEFGGACAELAFGTLVWAHALEIAGHADHATAAVHAAAEIARRGQFDLERCEYGASIMLRTDTSRKRSLSGS